jgi:hypothetical protein
MQKPVANETQILAKIAQLKIEGHVLMHEQDAELTPRDLKILSFHKWLVNIVFALGLLFINGMVYNLSALLTSVENLSLWRGLFMAIVSAGLGYVYLRDAKNFNRQIRLGKKTVVRGIVTNKRKKSGKRTAYYLEIDTWSINVRQDIYHKYQIGHGIEIHFFKPRHQLFLFETKMESLDLKFD